MKLLIIVYIQIEIISLVYRVCAIDVEVTGTVALDGRTLQQSEMGGEG